MKSLVVQIKMPQRITIKTGMWYKRNFKKFWDTGLLGVLLIANAQIISLEALKKEKKAPCAYRMQFYNSLDPYLIELYGFILSCFETILSYK